MAMLLNGNELPDVRCKTCGKCLGHVLEMYRFLVSRLFQIVSARETIGRIRLNNNEDTIRETCHVLACETLGVTLVCDKATLMSTIITPPVEFSENFSSPLVFDFSGTSTTTQRKYGQAASVFSSSGGTNSSSSSTSQSSTSDSTSSSSTFIQELRKECETIPSIYEGL